MSRNSLSDDEIVRLFGARILRERTRRGWSLRDLDKRTGGKTSYSAINRAERAVSSISLATAARIAAALGIPLGELVAPPECSRCDGHPPEGFICGECGLGGAG